MFWIQEFRARLARIEGLLIEQKGLVVIMTTDLTALQEEVKRNTSVEQGALALIQGLTAKIEAAGTDPAALQAIVDELKANDDQLAAAVAANTSGAAETAA